MISLFLRDTFFRLSTPAAAPLAWPFYYKDWNYGQGAAGNRNMKQRLPTLRATRRALLPQRNKDLEFAFYLVCASESIDTHLWRDAGQPRTHERGKQSRFALSKCEEVAGFFALYAGKPC